MITVEKYVSDSMSEKLNKAKTIPLRKIEELWTHITTIISNQDVENKKMGEVAEEDRNAINRRLDLQIKELSDIVKHH